MYVCTKKKSVMEKLIENSKLSRVQQAYLMLLQSINCNNLDGALIVRDLLQNKELWVAVVPDFTAGDLNTRLRDDVECAQNDIVSIDTIYVKTTGKHLGKWNYFAQRWNADEFTWVKGKDLVCQFWFD